MLKGVPSGRTGVEELWQEEAIWTLKCKVKQIADRTVTEGLVGRTTQKQQQTWESDNTVRCSSHWDGSPQNKLGDKWTYGITLASVYILRHLSAAQSQLQMEGRKFVDYQTSKLQYNYQSYIQTNSIGDAQSFSSKTPITLSGDFSVETLTGVTPLWKTELNRSISTIEDRIPRQLQYCHETCCKKGGCYGRQACMIWRQFHCRDVISRQVDLYMTVSFQNYISQQFVFSNKQLNTFKNHILLLLTKE